MCARYQYKVGFERPTPEGGREVFSHYEGDTPVFRMYCACGAELGPVECLYAECAACRARTLPPTVWFSERDRAIHLNGELLALNVELLGALESIRDLDTPGATSCTYEGAELATEMAAVARAAIAQLRGRVAKGGA